MLDINLLVNDIITEVPKMTLGLTILMLFVDKFHTKILPAKDVVQTLSRPVVIGTVSVALSLKLARKIKECL